MLNICAAPEHLVFPSSSSLLHLFLLERADVLRVLSVVLVGLLSAVKRWAVSS